MPSSRSLPKIMLAVWLSACAAAQGAEPAPAAAQTEARGAAAKILTEAGLHPSRKGSTTFLRWTGEGNSQLMTVYLYGPKVTDEALAQLVHFPELKLLELRETRVTDAGLEYLKKLTNLEHLAFLPIDRYTKEGIRIVQWSYPTIPPATEPTPVTDAGLVHLTACRKLKVLELLDTRVTPAGVAALAELPGLHSIGVDFPLDEAAGKSLEQLKKCTRLRLGRRAWTPDRGVIELPPQFKELTVDAVPLDRVAVAELCAANQWTTLDLGNCGLTDADLEPLANQKRLTSLRLGRNRITGPGLAALNGCPELKILILDYADLRDDTLKHLAGLPALEDVWLNYNVGVTNAGLASGVLQKMETLRYLRLRGLTHIDDGALETFVGLKQLKGLVVRSTPFSPKAVDELRKLRPELGVLK